MIEVLVLDSSEADFYETEAIGSPLRKRSVMKNPAARLHESKLVSDAPGRSFNRMAGIHQSYGERHTVHDYAIHEFVRKVAIVLAGTLNDDCAGLFLVASPRLLSQLDKALPPAARARIVGKLPKDLMHFKPSVIAKHLLAAHHHIQWRKGSLASHA